jgi:outer membrane protein TolC
MRAVVLLSLLALFCGCTRAHYRRSADRETYPLIAQNVTAPWNVPRISIDVPPESRLYDPYDPDHPPMPPDDPAADQYMYWDNGIRGAGRHWHKDGDAPFIEYPGWRDSLDFSDKGLLVLTPDKSLELGLLNSRDYQTQLENIYIAALGLTLARFNFALHWFGDNNILYTHQGSDLGNPNILTNTTDLGFTRNFAAGAQLLVEVANTFVWQFAGSGSNTANTNITINFLQPLLRNAGRKFVLEGLTQQERSVLYSVREFAHFRKSFYVNVTTGGSGGGPGFLNLLLQMQTIRNVQSNLVNLEQNLRLHEAQKEMGSVSDVQVDEVFQQVQQARVSVLQAQAQLDGAVDNFKILLGLPPTVPASIDDALLAPFQLNDPAITELQTDLDKFFAEYRELDAAPPLANLQQGFTRLQGFQERALKLWEEVDAELQRWKGELTEPAGEGTTAEARAFAIRTFQNVSRQVPITRRDIVRIGEELAADKAGLREARRRDAWDTVQKRVREEIALASELFVVQTQIRVYLIKLKSAKYQEETAIAYALDNRLDLMNQRAEVVDSWRQIAVTANQLRGVANVVFNGNIATAPGNKVPFNFSAAASSYNVGLQFSAPLNREAERNAYRLSQITYEQSRRTFMALTDQIEAAIRQDLRSLNADRQSFEIGRQSLVTAARSVEASRERLLVADRADVNDTTTLDILNALQNLLSAKNTLIGNWISFEQDRMRLLLDMEALPLNDRGVPIDEPDNTAECAPAAAAVAGEGSGRPVRPVDELPPPTPAPAR